MNVKSKSSPRCRARVWALLMVLVMAAFGQQAGEATAEPELGQDLSVVASIAPIHSLIANVMKGAGEPYLLVKGSGSPHAYALAPSDATALQHADLVFWVGRDLELFLDRSLKALAPGARRIALIGTPGMELLQRREPGVWSETDRDHEEHRHAGGYDPHIWLDPENAKLIVRTVRDALSKADPGRAALYAGNAARTLARLDRLSADLASQLAPVRDKPYIVFHDAFGYIGHRFGLAPAGAFTLSPDLPPGAARVRALRTAFETGGIVCAFIEPQANPHLVKSLSEETGVRVGVLDPLGATLAPGPDLYVELMHAVGDSLSNCLSNQTD